MSIVPHSSTSMAKTSGTGKYKCDREPYIRHDNVTGILFLGMGTGFATNDQGDILVPPDERTYDSRQPDPTMIRSAVSEAIKSMKEPERNGVKSNQAKWHASLSEIMKRGYNHEGTPSGSTSQQADQLLPKIEIDPAGIALDCSWSDVPTRPGERLDYTPRSQILPDAKIRFRDPNKNSLGFDVEVTVDGTARARRTETVVPLTMRFFDSMANTVASVCSDNLTAQLNSLKRLRQDDPQIRGVANSVAAVTHAVLKRGIEWDLRPYDIDRGDSTDADSLEMTDGMQMVDTAYTHAPTVTFQVIRGE